MGRRRRKPLPQEPVQALIENVTHDGQGIAYVDGKAVFIEGALPGEKVVFRYREIRRDFARGTVLEVTEPNKDRVTPKCAFFDRCGGCSLQHLDPAAQIRLKQDLLIQQFARIGKIPQFELWPPLTGPLWGYRRKARLGVKFVRNKGRVLVGFREKGSGLIADIDACLVLDPKVGDRLKDLATLIDSLTIKERIPQIEAAVGDNRSALVFRVLQPPSEEDLGKLKQFGKRFQFDIYLQPKGPDSVTPLLPENPQPLHYRLPEDIELQFGPLDFTQVNAAINIKMIHRVLETLKPSPTDNILDLFCGLGNFTLPLARHAGQVTGIEGNESAVEQARHNAQINQLKNTQFYCSDLTQDFSENPWSQATYNKILLDPSRAGAFEVMDWIPRWQPQRIVYVSCNPATLARDVGHLVHQRGYRLIKAGIMDMFPHTAHVESIALLEP
ncbi:MAG: 23S rRNA methyltransferase [Methylothermaceae bacteria B42]|nr:MAG: 23S rRNA methyltransferase [Methylothermaceae bacteria B42]HHJ38236.1 23S rRNA (uracil(1939)-C(5))-methyltransferase RlmD [Methylothermaceae bacterium]